MSSSSGILSSKTEHPFHHNYSTRTYNCENKTTLEQVSTNLFFVQEIVAAFIIIENTIVLAAILKNWYNLTRQHNIYRYLVSLVAADLLYGFSLFVHSTLMLVNAAFNDSYFDKKHPKLNDTVNNLLAGVLHGSCFASLASASLLNIVIRLTCTRALARAAAIDLQKPPKIPWLKLPSIRNLSTTRALIGTIWAMTMVFIFTPLRMHCHQKLIKCKQLDHKNESSLLFVGSDANYGHIGIRHQDCSLLRSPTSRTYLLILNCCITVSWFLMITCNAMAVCIKTTVVKTMKKESCNVVRLKLHHSCGFTWDSSSVLICIITISMTLSTVPYVAFTFLTEGGNISMRSSYAEKVLSNQIKLVEMTTYISSLLNPFIYMAMLSRLRGDVSRMLEGSFKQLLFWRRISCCTKFIKKEDFGIALVSNTQYALENRDAVAAPFMSLKEEKSKNATSC